MTDEKNFFFDLKLYAPEDLSKKWFVYWREDGKRFKKYGYINRGKTLEERKKLAAQFIQELSFELNPPSDLVFQKMTAWLLSKKPFWKPKSITSYFSILNEFERFLKGRKVNLENVELFFREQSFKLKGTTYNNYREKLGRLLRVVGEGRMIENIESVREERKPARFFQAHQIKQLKAEIPKQSPELWLFVQFIFYCFIRPGELRHLKVSDILFDDQKIIVRSSISKNRKSQYVAIPTPFRPHLEHFKEWRGDSYLFPSKLNRSKPIGINTMSARHRQILRKLGYSSDYKLYSWKHTGAVMAVQKGINLKELQMQLRHHSLDQVNDYLRQMGVLQMSNLKNNFPSL